MKYSHIVVLVALLYCLKVQAVVNSSNCGDFQNGKCIYNSDIAVKYARGHYGNKNNYPPFRYYPNANCTNFVNQAIGAGLVGSPYRLDVKAKIFHYQADRYASSHSKRWFYVSHVEDSGISKPWRGADMMYQYVQHKIDYPNAKGLQFTFVTQDSLTQSLEFSKIQKGDIIFVDWGYNTFTIDGVIDHVMMVTNKTSNSYGDIQVTYQSGGGDEAYKDISLNNLGYLGTNPQINSIFYVYRPTYYQN